MANRIKPGHGYWQTTTYPIGGCFRRAGADGVEIVGHKRLIEPPYKGCDIEVYLADGNTAAVAQRYTELVVG
jgi:hypothetical protein